MRGRGYDSTITATWPRERKREAVPPDGVQIQLGLSVLRIGQKGDPLIEPFLVNKLTIVLQGKPRGHNSLFLSKGGHDGLQVFEHRETLLTWGQQHGGEDHTSLLGPLNTRRWSSCDHHRRDHGPGCDVACHG